MTKNKFAVSLAGMLGLLLFSVAPAGVAQQKKATGSAQKTAALPASVLKGGGNLFGKINGESIEARVQTLCDYQTGELLAVVDFIESPDGFDWRMLNAIIITGYPRCSRAVGAASNPFRDSNLIRFKRTVAFATGEEFTGNISYDISSAGAVARYELKGTAPKVTLASVEPAVEVWTPVGNGDILGFFKMCWKTGGNNHLCADARSEYTQSGSSTMASFTKPHFRYITIDSSINGNRFEQEEEITLFKDFPGHETKLRNLKNFKDVLSGKS